MAEHTEISWADSTLNIWLGCTKVSNGPRGACEGCYAQVLVEERFGRAAWGPHAERVETKGWRAQLRKISRLAKAAGRPWFVFVNSLSDFWDNQADEELRLEALEAFRQHPHVTFLLLTKRPQNIVRLFRDCLGPAYDPEGDDGDWYLPDRWPRNVAIGCTVVTQEEADRDVPWLLKAKAALNPAFAFVSMEPLMGAVDLQDVRLSDGRQMQALRGSIWRGSYWTEDVPKLDWCIVGGETDQGKHKARPTDTEWYRSLRDQCRAAGVPFHLKQMTRKGPVPADLQIQERPQRPALGRDPHRPGALSDGRELRRRLPRRVDEARMSKLHTPGLSVAAAILERRAAERQRAHAAIARDGSTCPIAAELRAAADEINAARSAAPVGTRASMSEAP